MQNLQESTYLSTLIIEQALRSAPTVKQYFHIFSIKNSGRITRNGCPAGVI